MDQGLDVLENQEVGPRCCSVNKGEGSRPHDMESGLGPRPAVNATEGL